MAYKPDLGHKQVDTMPRNVVAGAVYFALVFAAGFALGAGRVVLLEPWMGALAATLTELPLILTIAWLTCGWVVARFRVPSEAGARMLMGTVAFALLMLAEAALSVLLFGRTLSDFLGGLATPQGALGLAGQVAFGLMPVVRR
jgi:hypothetical protein